LSTLLIDYVSNEEVNVCLDTDMQGGKGKHFILKSPNVRLSPGLRTKAIKKLIIHLA